MNLDETQRRFSVMGENTFRIANSLMTNKRICRLLKYQTRDPFNEIDPVTGKPQPDIDGTELINKQILIVPKFLMILQKKCLILLLYLILLL